MDNNLGGQQAGMMNDTENRGAANNMGKTMNVAPNHKGGKAKSKKGCVAGMVILAIVAVAGAGFGIWGMMSKTAQENTAKELRSDLEKKDAELEQMRGESVATDEVEDDEGSEIVNDVPTTVAENYIYIGQWGIKIKIPENLAGVSYAVEADGILRVSGATKDGGQYLPDFADFDTNRLGLGALTRAHEGNEVMGKDTNTVYRDGEWIYVYSGPQASYAQSDSEKQWELESIQAIKEMLSDGISKF